MLAQRLTTLLPPLSEDRAMEVATIHSISKIGFDVRTWKQPPFRAPHHTASAVALVGGGSHPAPGEISLAHHGVLFLDELPEFSRKVIEVMREPLESRKVNISRAQQSLTFPAHFQLICAMNPCPCGYLTDPSRECRCTPPQIEQYQHKISGPLLDRIDMHLEIPRVPLKDMVSQQKSEMTSEEARVQVDKARVIQFERQGKLNTEINPHREKIAITADAQDKCLTIVEKFSLSARSYYRIIKLARTLADLEASQLIEVPHIQEAFNLRKLDRVFKA